MAYASLSGRARTSAKNPQAHARCDRCSFRYNFVDLQWQHDYRGATVKNLRILVCRRCLDEINCQLRSIVLPADPEPIINARVEDFVADETDYRSLAEVTIDPRTGIPMPSTTLRVTEDCENRITQPVGVPEGLSQQAVMPYSGAVQKHFGVPLSILSVTSNGTATITATCSKPHGLQTDAQISAAGLTAANGLYSVTVINPMIFTWNVAPLVPQASLLTSTTRIVTALIGLPYAVSQVPVT